MPANPTPPFLRPRRSVQMIMVEVLLALAPAIIAYVWFFGFGLVFNIVIACAAALATEAALLRARGRPVAPFVADGSALVTAVLLAFALPPLTPWWLTALGAAFGIALGKQVYGGLGANVFNPAMAGYAALLIAFPDQMTNWLPPRMGDLDYDPVGFGASLHYVLTGALPAGRDLDALTRATPLDLMMTELGRMRTVGEVRTDALFGDFGGRGWEWIANFIALGGLWLLWRRIIRWQIPVAVLATLGGLALVFYALDPARHPGPGFHVFGGAAMLCAFFIATDPVSAAITDRGRLIYGAGIGALIFAIRTWGSYPDGVAFAVLAMNTAVPLIDRLTTPTPYGRANGRGP